jgi:hypothetical protein
MATFASTTKSMSLVKITITSVKRNGAGNPPGVRPVIVSVARRTAISASRRVVPQ